MVHSDYNIDYGLAMCWSQNLANMKRTEEVPNFLANVFGKVDPNYGEDLEQGKIILVGTSNICHLKNKLEAELCVEYILNMSIDILGMEASISRRVSSLKPTRAEIIVLGLLGKSFLVLKDKEGVPRLTGSKDTGHLIDPVRMD